MSFAALAAGGLPWAAPGASLLGGASDTEVRSDGTVSAVNATTLLAGGAGTPVVDRAAVYVIQLPVLGVVSNPFNTATFRFNLSGKTGTPANLDLYGLGRRAASTVVTGDYYGGTATADPTDATILQDNLLVATTAAAVISTNATGNTALKNYLNAQYAGGAGAGQYVFLRLSSDRAPATVGNYILTSADGGSAGPPDKRPQISYTLTPLSFARPFIWVRNTEKAGILAKIAGNPWATSVYNGMISRVAADVTSHQSNRDTFLRGLPVDWTLAVPKFKTIPAYSESSVRFPAEGKFNDGVDCAVLYYLTGDEKYARLAADVLHNAVKTLLPVAASTSTGNGGWIFQDDLLKEARVTGTQLPIIYDFLHSWLQTNQVYDVDTAAMVNFNFTNGQSVFRKLYQLVRDHGQKESNWSALMSTCMLNNLLALDSATERATALQIYLTTGTSRQASLQYDYRYYTKSGDIWPESLQYAGAVGSIRTSHMVLLERVDPSLNLFDAYPNLPLSLPRISYLRYPNGEQIMFGDGHRGGTTGSFSDYELVYQHALARGRTDLTSFFGSLINGGVAAGHYNRSTLSSYSPLGNHDEPLQLLWQAASLAEPAVSPTLPRTDTLPFAGIALQRNPAPSNNATYGLMGFVGGAAHIHSHASGMSMELFGMGEVMGAKAGTEDYGSTINENYYRLFASNNTVIVNGASRGEGGWGGFGINTVQTVAMEPQAFATAVSPDFSFTCSSFADDRGTQAEGTQQRTLAVVRTSPTSGFYVDVFRSKSTVSNQFHDYIYRNFGEPAVDLRADGATLPLTSQPNRFQTDIGDANEQPGWRYFTNTMVSAANSQAVRAQFVATVSGTARYMDLFLPAVASREYARVGSPAILEAPGPYHNRAAPTLVVRQIGEAWNKPFAAVYEPHFGSSAGTVQNVTQLQRSGITVGVKIESSVAGKSLVQYILSNPGAAETYTDASIGLAFTGRFGIASDNGDGTTTLYLGSGSTLSYRGNSVTTASGANSQAEVRFTPGQPPVVTANTPVNVIAAPLPPGGTWVPTAGGTGFEWTNPANWNPAVVPDRVGGIAYKNVNLTGDQTVNVNSPVTLGELVVGDSSGSQSTLLQKNTSGSLVFDQSDNGLAYLTRTAGGTGTVTLASDLNITLNDNLTVRPAGGTAGSTIVLAGPLAGSNKSLTKEGASLTLALGSANTFSGATRIAGGILGLDHSMALQNSALDTLNSVTGNAAEGLRTALPALTFGGLTGDKALASVFTTTAGGYSGVTALTLNPETGASPSYSGVIANGAAGLSLTKTGPGTQTLAGTNTYTGSTTLAANSGTLEIGGTGKLGNGTYAGGISIGSGSTFRYSSSAAQTLDGAISGSGALLKNTSASTLTLGGANTSYTGSVTVNAGTLALDHANALSSATAITLTGTPILNPTVQNATINAPITISGTPTINAPDFGSGSTTSTLTIGGAISGPGNLTLGSTALVASNSSQTIRLNAQSSYTGTTALHPTGNDANLIVKPGIANALPPATVLSINGGAGGGSGRSAKLDLNGFSQTLGGLQNTAVSLRSQQILNSSTAAATLTINTSAEYTFSGDIDGSNLSLTKLGTGTQRLSGTNSYTGTTTISAGKLQGVTGGNCVNSTVILNHASATLGVSITDNTKTWTCAALTTSAAGNLEFDFGSILPGSVKPLTVTGLANFSTRPTVRIVVATGLAPGTYPLMAWGSTSGTAPVMVSMFKPNGTSGLAGGTLASLSIAGSTLNLVITPNGSVLTKANNTTNLNVGGSWVGGAAPGLASTVRWDSTVTTANTTVLGANVTWAGITVLDPAGTVTINPGHTLTLGENDDDIDLSAATSNLTLNCPLTLGAANIWNVGTGRTLTIEGVVSGDFSVSKTGAGTALLSGANTYTGDTLISANSGTLEIGGDGRLGSGTYAAAIDIGTGSAFRYNSSLGQTLSGALSGAGTLSKSAASTLTLSSADNTFTGAIAINAGTLDIGNPAALGAAGTISIAGGAALSSQITGVSTAIPITLGTTGTTSTISFGRNSPAQGTMTINSRISGAGNLTLTTPNVSSGANLQTIVLGSANTYGGSTLITTGNSGNTFTVKATAANVLPASTVLTLNGGNGSGSGRTVTFDLNGHDQTLTGLTNSISTLTARNQRITNTSTEVATLTINNTADFSFGGAGISSSFNGNPINPTAQITGNLELNKTGTGKFTLAAGSGHSFNGASAVLAGILSLGHPASLQNSPLDTLNCVAGDAANGLQTTVTTLTLGGLTGDKNLASVFTTTSGGYSGLTALTLNPGAGTTWEYSGLIADGAAGMNLTKIGPGTQILAGGNTYTGDTTLNAGTLTLGANNVLPDITDLIIGSATLDAATFTDTIGTLDLTSAATINLSTGAALAFADSSAIDWTGGSLILTGDFASGASLRFGTSNAGLTSPQLASISAEGFTGFSLDSSGYLIANAAGSYATWQTANGTSQASNLDHDNDGVQNGIEHFLGGNTNTTGFTALPGVSHNSGTLSITWTRHAIYSGNYGTGYVVETSPTLSGGWTAEPADPEPGHTVTFPSANEIKFTFPPGLKIFVRLKVMP